MCQNVSFWPLKSLKIDFTENLGGLKTMFRNWGEITFDSLKQIVHSVEILQDFSATQMLREIKFRDSRGIKTAILTHLEALIFDFFMNFCIF